jgi:hypothetical protein
VARLLNEPAVRAFVAGALMSCDGDVERAATLMQLRLARGHADDGRVLELVVGATLVLAAAAEEPAATRMLRVRAAAARLRLAALCDRSEALLERGRLLRAWATESCLRIRESRRCGSKPGSARGGESG